MGIAPAVRKALDGFRCPCEMDGIDWQREREPSHGQAGERGKPLSMFKSKYNVLEQLGGRRETDGAHFGSIAFFRFIRSYSFSFPDAA